ncbi:MAG TPA: glycerol-3-phosphate acyltransferase [Ignavibacteria bacterium]|nr:glycerol-3-phosphate acyltransferase [Ignavibacteria bacterium]HRJ03645.1 glycerol-3-phosphate acyltransferase [Ignavibacteria bacterium]HRJ84280.1 glycerol-3-phosphate acyltransferase [Ignavibacteria bacterium]
MAELFTINNFVIFVLCYLIGSFPTAYILVKLRSNKDLTKEGSGNVGTLNSFTVSKSKAIGITVLLIDILKGALPVYFMMFIMPHPYLSVLLGACALILGHNYPVWLRFKGGRGLATGAGIFLVVNYYIFIGWCVVWLLVFILKRKVLIANTAATFSLPMYVLLINFFSFMLVNSQAEGFSLNYFNVYSIIITAIILSRHTEVFKKENK